MSTATTATATDASSGVIEEDGAGQPSNQERRSSGPADGVHLTSRAPGARPRLSLMGDDAVLGRVVAPLDHRWIPGSSGQLRSGDHSRRCDGKILLGIPRRRGGRRVDIPGAARGVRSARPVVQPVHRSRQPLLHHAEGRRETQSGSQDPDRPGWRSSASSISRPWTSATRPRCPQPQPTSIPSIFLSISLLLAVTATTMSCPQKPGAAISLGEHQGLLRHSAAVKRTAKKESRMDGMMEKGGTAGRRRSASRRSGSCGR